MSQIYNKGRVVCQEKTPQDMGYFLKPSGENLTGSFFSGITFAMKGTLVLKQFKIFMKEMTIPLMPQVKIDHIPREKFSHTLGNRLSTRPNQQMKVVGQEGPGIYNESPIDAQIRQPVQEIFPVLIRAVYLCPFDAPAHDMMQRPRSIQPWLSRHTATLHPSALSVKLF